MLSALLGCDLDCIDLGIVWLRWVMMEYLEVPMGHIS
jgi:hypothetical protein